MSSSIPLAAGIAQFPDEVTYLEGSRPYLACSAQHVLKTSECILSAKVA